MSYLTTIKNIKKTTTYIAFLSLLSLLSSCSTGVSSGFKQPDMQLVDVELVRARLLEQQFILHFRLDNPNSQSLPVRSVNYQVLLNNTPLANGSTHQLLMVPAHDHAYFKIPVQTNLWQHMKVIVRMLEKPDQAINYTLHADVRTGRMFGKNIKILRHGDIIPGDYIRE